MTKVFLQPGLRALSGGMGDWVYQIRKGKTVVGMKPLTRKTPSDIQLAQRNRFAAAAAYARGALADPVKRAFYEMVAKEKGKSVFALAVADYLNTPSFKPLDLTLYKGKVGDPILICAVDDIGFTSVDVEMVTMDGTSIENGSAVETAARSGNWIYTATAPVALGSDIFIKVEGLDHTGKKALLNENPVVGQQS